MIRVALGVVRTLIGVPVMAIITLCAAIYLIVLLKIRPKTPQAKHVLKLWGRAFLFVTGTRVTVEGLEKLDPAGSYVFTGNHISNLDVPTMVAKLPVSVRFLAKAELFRVPFLGGAMTAIHMVETDRTAGTAAHRRINEQVETVVDEGLSLVIYPEGTRSKDAELKPFKKGAFRIAVDNGMPVVPTTITGTERAWKPGSKILYGGHAHLVIHDPIPIDGLTTHDLDDLRDRVRDIVSNSYAAIRA
jgi:1-acyl-sn-glycerol-3-phosphate acyltransferase